MALLVWLVICMQAPQFAASIEVALKLECNLHSSDVPTQDCHLSEIVILTELSNNLRIQC
jgi:hypothetical protein